MQNMFEHLEGHLEPDEDTKQLGELLKEPLIELAKKGVGVLVLVHTEGHYAHKPCTVGILANSANVGFIQHCLDMALEQVEQAIHDDFKSRN